MQGYRPCSERSAWNRVKIPNEKTLACKVFEIACVVMFEKKMKCFKITKKHFKRIKVWYDAKRPRQE